jgi:hypothetical protein
LADGNLLKGISALRQRKKLGLFGTFGSEKGLFGSFLAE